MPKVSETQRLRQQVEELKQLLVDADSTARDRGDEQGLCDCLSKNGQSHPSPRLLETLEQCKKQGMRPSHFVDESGLNPRQKAVLYQIFHHDQLAAYYNKNNYFNGAHTPASEWRALLYDRYRPPDFLESYFKRCLREEKLVDPGIGSTFKALSERGLITVDHSDWVHFGTFDVKIRLTRKGRSLARKLFPDHKIKV
jgi:hypothetical protein